MPHKRDLTGFSKEHFRVIHEVTPKQYACGVYEYRWLCVCACGTAFVRTTSYIIGRCKSCGCKRFDNITHGNSKHSGAEASWKRVLNTYVQRAKRDGIKWSLTDEQARALFSSDCYYCGIKPSTRVNAFISGKRYLTNNTSRADKSWIVFNGIDRVDNDGDYINDNCVPCCYDCNRAKHTLSFAEFEAWLSRITAFREGAKKHACRSNQ